MHCRDYGGMKDRYGFENERGVLGSGNFIYVNKRYY